MAAIESGDLIETATLDAKAALPAQGKSKELAKDVAAMANDGGTLLYGVSEDENGRPTIPKPVGLAGARERVNQIVHSSISEPPEIEVREVETDGDSSTGYLVVAVPPSPRAPHMVMVGKDHRYYGRSDTGNVLLTEGEVARLYERRQKWEIDRHKLLDEAISRAPIDAHDDFAFLHLVARPVVPDEGLFDWAKGGLHEAEFLEGLFAAALRDEVFSRSAEKGYLPDLTATRDFDLRADGWTANQGLGDDRQTPKNLAKVLQLVIGLDGSGRLFCGGAARRSNDGRLLLIEDLVAGLTARFLCVLGGLYAAGRLAEGAWEDAARCLSEAFVAHDVQSPEFRGYVQTLLAQLDLLRGCPAEALARLEPYASDLTSIRDAQTLSVLAEAYADTGEAARAEETVDLALMRAGLMRNQVSGLEASRIRAKILTKGGRREEAIVALEEALSGARSMPYPYAEGKILREYGILYIRESKPERARGRLSAALGIFVRLGAKKYAEQTGRTLQKLGRS